MKRFFGFTLAEIMIALVVIGVITSILLPVAFNNVPNENIMKFKKGNATLAKVINELATSGEYYKDGDLGIKPDGTLIDGTHDGDYAYLCKTFADILNTSNVNCSTSIEGERYYYDFLDLGTDFKQYENNPQGWTIIDKCDLSNYICWFDSGCHFSLTKTQIIKTSDNIIFYQANNMYPFGAKHPEFADTRLFTDYKNEVNQSRVYKYICMDVDGIDKGEKPFGYGLRVDGKIILGARAQEWLEKSIQEK